MVESRLSQSLPNATTIRGSTIFKTGVCRDNFGGDIALLHTSSASRGMRMMRATVTDRFAGRMKQKPERKRRKGFLPSLSHSSGILTCLTLGFHLAYGH